MTIAMLIILHYYSVDSKLQQSTEQFQEEMQLLARFAQILH